MVPSLQDCLGCVSIQGLLRREHTVGFLTLSSPCKGDQGRLSAYSLQSSKNRNQAFFFFFSSPSHGLCPLRLPGGSVALNTR